MLGKASGCVPQLSKVCTDEFCFVQSAFFRRGTEVAAISLATGRDERQASGRHIDLAQQRRLGARKPKGGLAGLFGLKYTTGPINIAEASACNYPLVQ